MEGLLSPFTVKREGNDPIRHKDNIEGNNTEEKIKIKITKGKAHKSS